MQQLILFLPIASPAWRTVELPGFNRVMEGGFTGASAGCKVFTSLGAVTSLPVCHNCGDSLEMGLSGVPPAARCLLSGAVLTSR